MIEIEVGNNDTYFVKVGMKSPIIYLDHWAVAKIAANPGWRNRFSEALHKHDGTLLFSLLNIVELARHINAQPNVKLLLDGVGTQWCFIDVNPPAVIEREEKWVPSEMPPCFDETLIRSFYPYIHESSLSLSEIVDLISEKKVRYDEIYELSDKTVEQMTALQDAIKNHDPRINPDAYKPGDFNPEQPTKYVYHSFMRDILWRSSLKLTRNHIADLQHATAALAYADFILLDGHWYQQALNLMKELPNLKARLFRDSPDEMERFLGAFENVQID